MFEFLKNILSELISLFKSDDKSEEAKFKKIVYSIIILCAVIFIGLLIFYTIKAIPGFSNSVQENFNDSKQLLDKNINLK